MKCRKCGTEFSEGIFCPECGFKNIDEKISEPAGDGEEKQRLAEKERELLEKERRLREEQERIAKEQRKKEQEQIEKEKLLEAERKQLDAENADRERAERKAVEEECAAREREESEKLLKDNEIIDILKNKLMSTRSQEERRKMLSEFDEQLNCIASQKRIEELRNKVNQKQPHGSMANWIFGVSVILAIVAAGILGGTGNAESQFLIVAAIWYGLGIPVWILWRIVLVVQSRSKKFCLNIKHI